MAFRAIFALTFLVAFSSSQVLAGEGRDSESRENSVFEPQGEVTLPDFRKLIEWLRREHVLDDGIIELGYGVYKPAEGGGERLGRIDLTIETRVVEICERWGGRDDDGKCPGSNEFSWNRTHAVPIEVTIRTRVDGNPSASLQALRVAAFRALNDYAGISASFGGFSTRQYEFGLGRNYSFELGSFTFNEVVKITNSGSVALVFKGSVTLGFISGTTTSHPMAKVLEAQAKEAGDVDDSSTNVGLFGGEASGSVGLRIAERVLVDLYGGVRKSSLVMAGTKLTHAYWGTGARVKLTNWAYLRGILQRDVSSLDVDYYAGETAGSFTGKTTARATMANGYLELRW